MNSGDSKSPSEQGQVDDASSARLTLPYLLAETDHLVSVLESGLGTIRSLCITLGAMVFAVVGLTGAVLSSGAVIDVRYSSTSCVCVISGSLGVLLGLLAIIFYENAVSEAKLLRTYFEFQDRTEAHKSKEKLEKMGRSSSRFAVYGVYGLTSLTGVAALATYFEAVF